ncbi:S49 family peptidase [Maritalea sp. S77]|jgi:signal peptide peptidase SppA|uniref:S49 family peptidase n=1 Tax=Maritalea sp. S77 TaxID=3415125 RepID=UPI003C7CDDB3
MHDDLTDEIKAPWHARLLGRDNVQIPVVRLTGTIEASQKPDRINIASAAPMLKRAFKIKNAPAVAIIINSPGGSPVQSRMVAKYIRDLAKEKDKKVLVFVEDVAASGGYFIASAGDEIIADPASIVGSIGVISAGFGFVDAIEKLGVSRRVYTAGENKSTLDPFLPEDPKDVERLKKLQLDVHEVFKDYVKERRGNKLNLEQEGLFSGEFWTAKTAIEFGLVDALGDIYETLKKRYGKKVKLVKIEEKRGFFSMPRIPFLGGQIGQTSLSDDMLSTLKAQAHWSRFGL